MSEAEKRNIEKLKTLPLVDLVRYKSAAASTKTSINLVGISCFLMIFILPSNLFISIPLVFLTSLLANIGVGIDNFLVEIKKNLLRFPSTDK
jgi:hypothetical protein